MRFGADFLGCLTVAADRPFTLVDFDKDPLGGFDGNGDLSEGRPTRAFNKFHIALNADINSLRSYRSRFRRILRFLSLLRRALGVRDQRVNALL